MGFLCPKYTPNMPFSIYVTENLNILVCFLLEIESLLYKIGGTQSEISENGDDLWPVHANVAAGGRHKERESPEEAGVHRRGEKGGRDGNSHLASRIVCSW